MEPLLDQMGPGEEDKPRDSSGLHAAADTEELLQVFGPPFARSPLFWRSALLAAVQGCLMGGLALAFFCGFEGGSKLWLGDEYEDSLKAAEFGWGSGKPWWPLFTTAAGLVIGLLRLSPGFPEEVHGLFFEVWAWVR